MYPESDSSSDMSEPVSLTVSVPSSKLALQDLERKVEQLTESSLQLQEDSLSSGVDSLKADLEEEIQTSVSLARRHGQERLQTERRRHSEHLDSLAREVHCAMESYDHLKINVNLNVKVMKCSINNQNILARP